MSASNRAGSADGVEGGLTGKGVPEPAADPIEASAAAERAGAADAAEASEAKGEPDEAAAPAKPKKPLGRRILKACIIVAVVAAVVYGIVIASGVYFTAQEGEVRSDWSVDAGDLITSDGELGINVHEAAVDSTLRVLQLVPSDSDEDGFTYYDIGVQNRLASAIAEAKELTDWTAENPLAVLNPFGTGTNGLYLYFETDRETQVSYTIHVDDPDVPDYTAAARNGSLGIADEGADAALDADVTEASQSSTEPDLSREHEFQIVGLVPGETNEVTITVRGAMGAVRQEWTFSIDVPDTQSGYPTRLSMTDGESDAELSDGLYCMARTNGYLGYGFFYDNDGVMRYEMVTEGLGLDRILEYGDDIVVCSSAYSIARIDGLGRVVAVYDLNGYELHHDINYAGEGKVVALAEHADSEFVEDVVIEVDLATSDVEELVDFTELMRGFVDESTRAILPTDTFFWQVGERDWIHLNTVCYDEADDAVIVSSRETSTIMRVENVHDDPVLAYFIGDAGFWEGTEYEDLNLEQASEFKDCYGQHSVEIDGAGEREGTYYLLLFDNNYWANSTRDGYAPDLSGADTSTDLYNGEASYVYRYLVDEQAGTYELVDSFPVPYSSIVSNVTHAPSSDNYVVNSGISNVYGEYDADGELIREFAYTCQLQGYRTFKDDFVGFWYETPVA